MFTSRAKKISPIAKAITICLVFAAIVAARVTDGTITDAGVVISIRAEATYSDSAGAKYEAVSETVSLTVSNVATLVVTPDESLPSDTVGPHEQVTRIFRVCNTGNNNDNFSITHLELTAPATLTSLYFDNDGSGTLTNGDTAIQLNQTPSPQLPPHGCLGVLAVINTNDAVQNNTITLTLTARSNATNAANGQGEDRGTIINTIGLGARLTDPSNSNLPPVQLINGLSQAVVSSGATLNYSISFGNSGDVVAKNVLVENQLSTGVDYVPGSLRLNDQTYPDASDNGTSSVRNNGIQVRIAQAKPGDVFHITFQARLVGANAGGSGLVSPASFSGDNFAPLKSSAATAVIDPFGLVFAGRAGGSVPIAGAHVEVLADSNGDSFVTLPADEGFAPNEKNENPFVSDAQGRFSFAPDIAQSAATYFMRVSAKGYIGRQIQLDIRPTQPGLFNLKIHALDGQPLASAGGFDLVREDTSLGNLAALVMNIPMFEPTGLQIVKSADRGQVQIGDTVTYRIELTNPTSSPIHDVVVNDHLPPSFHFASGSALINLGAQDEAIVPEVRNDDLVFHVLEIPHGATAKLLYRVRVGANAREGDQINTAVASGVFPSGDQTTSAAAHATVNVSAGVFSTQQAIVGRVFVDTDGDGKFTDADRPMPGVRLYLTNGQSVITDSAGLYSFPSLGDGPQVISLDPITVPKGYALADGGVKSGKTWTRLLRTPIGGGALLRQNFALIQPKGSAIATTGSSLQTAAETNPADGKSDSAAPAASPANPIQRKLPGTYEVAATETIEPVSPGEVRIVSPASNSVSMAPALEIEARTALNWNVRLEVNGEQVSENNIGVRAADRKNQVTTFTFVGINVRPGPNKIRATAISPAGAAGHSAEIVVMGRGPAKRLEIVSERSDIQSGGGDSTTVHVKAFDEWNHPALDGQVGVETSAGLLARANDNSVTQTKPSDPGRPGDDQRQTGDRLIVQLENGEAAIKLTGSGTPAEARIHAETGQLQAEDRIRIISETRPTILVGMAQMSFGPGIPEVALRNETGNYRSRLSLFYNGPLFHDSMLTLSYDSQRPINRTAGRDRLFQLDPLDRVYPVFGDSSTRFEAAPSNSKLYARIDHKRSYLMFGDFDTDIDATLAGYTRKLTGVKAHLENSRGDFVTLTGARPDTAFARDVFAAGALGLIQLSNAEILPGSETVTLELRDRRNPEVIISRETLTRSIDYNLDPATGRLFLLRYISTFDEMLNLMQFVVTYEHRAASMNTAVYTLRARKNFKGLGLKLGLSAVLQRQAETSDFAIGGADLEKTLPHHGTVQMEWASSRGEILGTGNIFDATAENRHDGNAYRVALNQPLPFWGTTLRGRFQSASQNFFNPFGGTVTPGSRRGDLALEMKPLKNSTLRFGFTTEQNKTVNVDNGRQTLSAAWDQVMNDHIRVHFGFDHRALTDNLNDKTTDSNLVTAGVDVKVTDKLQFAAKREQNLGAADPTYPTQTTLGATYQLNSLAKLFFTQRLASAPITPIGDFTANGFASSSARRETAVGVETRLGKYTSLNSRYQLENGVNGTDSFAVIGLQNRLPLTKELSVELGFERGFHLLGPDQSFNSVTAGFGWQPSSDFRATARYEYRDRNGLGQQFALGAAGKVSEGITALSRFQFSRGSFQGRSNETMEGMAALAIRPTESDRAGLLFSYEHRSLDQNGINGDAPTRNRRDTISSDGYYQPLKHLELFGRVAANFNADGQPGLPYTSTLTYLGQARTQYQFAERFDAAFEARLLFQPSSKTQRTTYGSELGFWALPDLRLGVGYNFNGANEPDRTNPLAARRGFYFTITSKLSNLFNLFGTSKNGLASSSDTEPQKKSGP